MRSEDAGIATAESSLGQLQDLGEIQMANVAVALREEIRRLARKEVRAETGTTRQAVAQYRRDIARLKKQVREQEKRLAYLHAQERKRLQQPAAAEDIDEGVRYSARSVRAQRKRLGISAADYARLLGVSQLTVYNWEHGKSRPRKEQLASLVALRGIGKREAVAKLEVLKTGEPQPASKPRPRRAKKSRAAAT
jgi:DNA-binding transcriptional regulator YiaG